MLSLNIISFSQVLIYQFTFCLVLGSIYKNELSTKKNLKIYSSFMVLAIILNILSPRTILIPIILLYFYLSYKKPINYYLINSMIISLLTRLLSFIIIVLFLANFVTPSTFASAHGKIELALTQLVFTIIWIYFYKFFNLDRFFNKQESPMTSIFLGYIYIAFYTLILMLESFRSYVFLVVAVLLFTLLQIIFVDIIFFHERTHRKKIYQDKLAEEQIINLKVYTDQLESDQLKLRHFKHDYKNLLFSLKTVADEHDYDAMNTALNNLENYSDGYLNNLSMELYQDLNNVKNSDLKSLLISKLNIINQDKITCHFHCHNELNEIPIDDLDLITLLSTAIDNAIEFTKRQEHGEIQLDIIQEGQQLAFLINNSITNQQLHSEQEKKHLELLKISKLKKKYSNLFIQYNQNEKWFRFHVTLITKGD